MHRRVLSSYCLNITAKSWQLILQLDITLSIRSRVCVFNSVYVTCSSPPKQLRYKIVSLLLTDLTSN